MDDIEQGQETQEIADPQEPAEQENPPEEPAEGEEPKEESEGEPDGEEAKPDAEAKEDGAEPETEAKGEEKRKRAGGWQRKLERQERELEYWRQQAMQQQGQQPPPPGPEQTPEQKANAYVQNMVSEGIRAEKEREKMAAQHAEFQRRTQEAVAAHPDFEDVVAGVNHIPLSQALQQVILTSGVGPEIMYQLAKNPGELARISALHPLDAAREIGRLEARASVTPTPKTTTKSAARPPAPPTNVGGSKTSTRSLEDLPLADYKRAYRSGRR